MTQEDKELLLKDLCARLPYGVKIRIEYPFVEEKYWHPEDLCGLDLRRQVIADTSIRIEEFKPYLRPMSSMTEEEKKEFIHYAGYEVEESVNGRHYEYYLIDYVGTPEEPTYNCDSIDWLNKHHFDYRGLIEKGLAIKAHEEMYKI